MKFVEEMMARVPWINQFREFGPQRLDLFVVKSADAGEIAIFMEELNLIFGETKLIPVISFNRRWKKV